MYVDPVPSRYAEVGPWTQCLESYNRTLASTVLMNSRCSKEYLISSALPEMLLLDSMQRCVNLTWVPILYINLPTHHEAS